jgi:prepilin signal peptidase PulO-like enzyme (type II secretory pathway)
MALLSSLVLLPSAGWYAGLFFIVPLVAFFLISRVPDEAPTVTLARFFGGNDMAGLPQDALPVPENATEKESENSSRALEEKLQEEADQFAKEAETGSAGGMGMGDVKLAFGIGALLGPGLSLLSLLFATFLGALTGMLLAARYGKNLKLGVPFVPFMAAGAIIALLFGNAVIGWYLTVTGLNKTENPPPAVTRPIRPTP